MNQPLDRRRVGTEYELKAAKILSEQGCQILEHSYHSRRGEIDLIANDNGTLIFIEVKYRRNASYGTSLEAVDPRKQNRIRQTALFYLMDKGLDPDRTPIRFDVIGFDAGHFTHLKGAF